MKYSLKAEEAKVKKWNGKHLVGQWVSVRKDNGELVAAKTTAPACLMGGAAVCWFDNISGCYELDRVSAATGEGEK